MDSKNPRGAYGAVPLVTNIFATLLVATLLIASPVAAQVETSTAAARAQAAPPGAVRERVEGTGPNGAAVRCRDGSFHQADAAETACGTRGGVLVRFPLKRTPIASGERMPRVPAPPSPHDTATAAGTAPSVLAEPMVSRANVFVPAERPPQGATLQCGDGSFVVADTSRARCATRGGVRFVIPQDRSRPPARP